jgi:hypothetical protein
MNDRPTDRPTDRPNERTKRYCAAGCRFYRYLADGEETFRAHRDDPNPGAAFATDAATGRVDRQHFDWDADGERFSLLTFLLYLNDDFEGGETTLFVEEEEEVGEQEGGERAKMKGQRRRMMMKKKKVRAVPVRPEQGSVLVFPQTAKLNDSEGERRRVEASSPLHEGSVTTRRRHGQSTRPKYVMRSDVLYSPFLDEALGWRFGELEDEP